MPKLEKIELALEIFGSMEKACIIKHDNLTSNIFHFFFANKISE